jgi:uncharacterized protein YbjQ (UPF0145 family)
MRTIQIDRQIWDRSLRTNYGSALGQIKRRKAPTNARRKGVCERRPLFPKSNRAGAKKKQTMEVMQVSYTNRLEGGRRHHSIGRVKASSGWRAVSAPAAEADRFAAVRALIREAEEYEADAIIGLDFEVDSVNCADIGGAPLQRAAATGIVVKLDEAA